MMILFLNAEERPDSELSRYRNLDLIKIEEIRAFIAEAINEFGNEDLLEKANCVADRLVAALSFRGLRTENIQQSFVDLQIASALIYNLFYKESDWRTLFDARYMLTPLKERLDLHQQAYDAIMRTVECQLGSSAVIPELRPNPNTPQELFADIVFHETVYRPLV